jgi:type IV secretory pathway VirB3-like protein
VTTLADPLFAGVTRFALLDFNVTVGFALFALATTARCFFARAAWVSEAVAADLSLVARVFPMVARDSLFSLFMVGANTAAKAAA